MNQLRSLREVAILVMGTSPKGETYNKQAIGVPLLNGPTEFGPAHPNCSLFTTAPIRTCEPGDLLFCVRGSTTGRMNWADRRYALGRGVAAIRGESVLETRYVRYALEVGLPSLLARAGGGTFPNLTQGDIASFEIPWPDARHKIAAVLAAYDELVESNLRRIEILGEMADALYREWFVNLRFPGHERGDGTAGGSSLPEGWDVMPLFDIADVAYGFAFKSGQFTDGPTGNRVVRIRDIPRGTTSTFTSEAAAPRYAIRDDDILIGMDGDFHLGIWADGPAVQNQRVARVRPRGRLPTLYLFHALRRPISELNRSISGTTVAHLGDRHLRDVTLVVPPRELLEHAKQLLDPLLALGRNLHKQVVNLRASRDMLLPKLVAGTLDVSELDIDSSWLAP